MSKHTLVGGNGHELLDLLARLKTRAEQHIAAPFRDISNTSRARHSANGRRAMARGVPSPHPGTCCMAPLSSIREFA